VTGHSFPRILFAVLLTVAFVAAVAAPAASSPWTGTWRIAAQKSAVPFYGGNTFTLVQKGTAVTGRFTWELTSDKGFGGGFCHTGKGGTIKGTARGRKLTATMIWPARDGYARATAPFQATLSANGKTIDVRAHVTSGECASFGVYPVFKATRVK
jgi:hypothetical protein